MIYRPLAIDLFCGLFGWADGLSAEGWRIIGFDLEDMCAVLGKPRPSHVQLVIQDVLTLHGSQFRDADLIVASPPCQRYSWMAMPWKRAKAAAAGIRADETGQMLADLNRLFDACFRIQREACEAAGRHIPMVVENVRGAQPWVGRARWNFGSYYLWGDAPALMPPIAKQARLKDAGPRWDAATNSGQHGMKRWTNPAEGFKSHGMNWSDQTKRGQDFTRIASEQSIQIKGEGGWFGKYKPGQPGRSTSSNSKSRKAASALIAKIPLLLARHIGATFYPRERRAA